jgi:hypothetical protein
MRLTAVTRSQHLTARVYQHWWLILLSAVTAAIREKCPRSTLPARFPRWLNAVYVQLKPPLCLIKCQAMKTLLGSERLAPSFLILALYGSKWWASRSGRFIPGEIVPGTRCIGGYGWFQNRSGRCWVEKISCPWRKSNPGRSVYCPSLYRLSCPTSRETSYFDETQRLIILFPKIIVCTLSWTRCVYSIPSYALL